MIKKIIEQLSDEQFSSLQEELISARGEKFARLLGLYRQPELTEEEVRKSSGTSGAAFYTIKSRLQDKVQSFLFRQTADNRAELLANISSLPQLVYNAPRETAISMLEYLETQLQLLDLPAELAKIYSGLKKLHLHTDRFYHYQQLYNKNIAYSLALDKAEELVSLFTQELGYFMLSFDGNRLDLLRLYLKELNNLNKLYNSHRLKVNRLIALLSYILFTENEDESEETTEDLLRQFRQILDRNPGDRQYYFLDTVWHFLNFYYYHSLGLHKNAKASFEKINAALDNLFLLGHTCLASAFLLAKKGQEDNLKIERFRYIPDSTDCFAFINYSLFRSVQFFSVKQYSEASAVLNSLMNEISFKNYPFAECTVKLLLSLNLLLAGKTEQAEVPIRSISRKLTSLETDGTFFSATIFSRLLKTALQDNSGKKENKIRQLHREFNQANTGSKAILNFIRIEEEHLKMLSR